MIEELREQGHPLGDLEVESINIMNIMKGEQFEPAFMEVGPNQGIGHSQAAFWHNVRAWALCAVLWGSLWRVGVLIYGVWKSAIPARQLLKL